MKVFKVSGTFLMGNNWQKFAKEVVCEDKNHVHEYIYSNLGSKHRVNRKKINIESIEEITIDKIIDPIVKQKIMMEMKN